jgi:hypothetical protein
VGTHIKPDLTGLSQPLDNSKSRRLADTVTFHWTCSALGNAILDPQFGEALNEVAMSLVPTTVPWLRPEPASTREKQSCETQWSVLSTEVVRAITTGGDADPVPLRARRA